RNTAFFRSSLLPGCFRKTNPSKEDSSRRKVVRSRNEEHNRPPVSRPARLHWQKRRRRILDPTLPLPACQRPALVCRRILPPNARQQSWPDNFRSGSRRCVPCPSIHLRQRLLPPRSARDLPAGNCSMFQGEPPATRAEQQPPLWK